MGLTLSVDYTNDYAIYNSYLDNIEKNGVQKTYENLMIDDFCGLHQMEAVIRLIYHKATVKNPKSSLKYAQLAKKLENEIEGGTNHFPDVFHRLIENFVTNAIAEAGMLHDPTRKHIAMHITTFLGNLFNVGILDTKVFIGIVRHAWFNKRFESHVGHLTSIVKDKLKTLGASDLGELYTISQSKVEKHDAEKVSKEKTRGKLIKVDSLDFVTDFNSFCYHVDFRNNVKKDILHDEKMFNARLIASLGISSEDEISQLCERFVDRAILHENYLPVFGQLALKIYSALQNTDLKDVSFKNVLIDTIVKRFDNIPAEEEAEIEKRMVIALYGEMYNISWIKQATLNTFIGALKCLKNDHFYIILLQSLLKACGMKLSVQSSKDQMIELRDEVKRILKKEEKDGHLKYLLQDTLHMLNYIVGIREQSELKVGEAEKEKEADGGKLTVENLFKDMCEEAYLDVINDVKSKPINNVEEFIEKLIMKALSSCALMVAKATRDICTTVYMREVLSNKCHSTFLDYIKDQNKCGSTIRLLHYIGELYNLDVLTNDFINLTFEILFEHESEIGTTSISVLLRNVGSKMEIANIQKLESYFQFFEHIIMTEQSRRSREFKKLKALRANEWNEHGIQHSYEDFLILYTIENAEIEEVIGKFHSNPIEIEKFILALWKTVLKDPHPSYAELCKKLSKFSSEFNFNLVDFLKSRCNTFANLESQHYNESVNCRLGKVVVFISELYSFNVIPESLFEIWVDPRLASKIPHCYILTILSLIAPKVDAMNNLRLKTLVTNLEHINEDKSQQKWNSICGDMSDLKEALLEYKTHQKH